MISLFAVLLLILCVIIAMKWPAFAFPAMPIAVGVNILLLARFEDITALACAIITIPVTLLTIVIVHKRTEPPLLSYLWAKWTLIILVVFALAAPIIALTPPLAVYIVVLVPIFIAFIVRYSIISGYSVELYVISTINAAMRQNLPLPMALQSAAGNNLDKRARILKRLSKWLVQGRLLSDAIKLSYPKISSSTMAAINAAEKINQLPSTLESLQNELIEKADSSRTFKPINPIYPFIVIFIAGLITIGLMVFITPTLIAVMTDLGIPNDSVPYSTRLLVEIVRVLLSGKGVWFSLTIGLLLALAFMFIYTRFRRRIPQKPRLLSRIADSIKWHMPLVRWFETNYSLVRVVSILRASLNAGCTVDNAIANTINLDINNCFRKSLHLWYERVQKGENISQAAIASSLPRAISWAFDCDINRGDAPMILEMLEESCRTNYNYRANLVKFISCPLVILLLGIVVGFIIYAMFSPQIVLYNFLVNSLVP